MPSRFFRSQKPSVPAGQRVYAIGDVHGRIDLLDRLLLAIRNDNEARGPQQQVDVILLGDLIDRGPESAAVVRQAMQPLEFARFRCLLGNHESAMLDALDGKPDMFKLWIDNGGDAALESWGVDSQFIGALSIEEGIAAARRAIPARTVMWLRRLPISITIGDYYFVHAGIRPGVPLNRQTEKDQLWIRDRFLRSDAYHGAMVVHGHSVEPEVRQLANRIGIDTGAYRTDRLTALALEESDRWILQTGDHGGLSEEVATK